MIILPLHRRLIFGDRALTAVHNAVHEHANIGVFIPRDRFAAAHAARKHRINGAGELFDGWVVAACGNVHGT